MYIVEFTNMLKKSMNVSSSYIYLYLYLFSGKFLSSFLKSHIIFCLLSGKLSVETISNIYHVLSPL